VRRFPLTAELLHAGMKASVYGKLFTGKRSEKISGFKNDWRHIVTEQIYYSPKNSR
jgi:hypothetical protein